MICKDGEQTSRKRKTWVGSTCNFTYAYAVAQRAQPDAMLIWQTPKSWRTDIPRLYVVGSKSVVVDETIRRQTEYRARRTFRRNND